MINAIDSNDLLEQFDLYDQLVEKAYRLPWLTPTLIQTIARLRDEIEAELDELTRQPRKSLKEILAAKLAQPRTIPTNVTKVGFEYKNEFIPCTFCLDIWRKLLRKLWNDYPEKREILAASAKRFGYNRKYVSNEQQSLFKGKDDRWTRKHSKKLVDGWYMDINVTPERIQKILPAMASSVGLKWGADVVVTWR